MDAPKNGARCNPLMNPSTTVRASSSRLPIRDRIFGSTKRAPGMAWVSILQIGDWSFRNPQSAMLHSTLRCRDGRQQLVDDRIRADAFRLGAEVREHPV